MAGWHRLSRINVSTMLSVKTKVSLPEPYNEIASKDALILDAHFKETRETLVHPLCTGTRGRNQRAILLKKS